MLRTPAAIFAHSILQSTTMRVAAKINVLQSADTLRGEGDISAARVPPSQMLTKAVTEADASIQVMPIDNKSAAPAQAPSLTRVCPRTSELQNICNSLASYCKSLGASTQQTKRRIDTSRAHAAQLRARWASEERLCSSLAELGLLSSLAPKRGDESREALVKRVHELWNQHAGNVQNLNICRVANDGPSQLADSLAAAPSDVQGVALEKDFERCMTRLESCMQSCEHVIERQRRIGLDKCKLVSDALSVENLVSFFASIGLEINSAASEEVELRDAPSCRLGGPQASLSCFTTVQRKAKEEALRVKKQIATAVEAGTLQVRNAPRVAERTRQLEEKLALRSLHKLAAQGLQVQRRLRLEALCSTVAPTVVVCRRRMRQHTHSSAKADARAEQRELCRMLGVKPWRAVPLGRRQRPGRKTRQQEIKSGSIALDSSNDSAVDKLWKALVHLDVAHTRMGKMSLAVLHAHTEEERLRQQREA